MPTPQLDHIIVLIPYNTLQSIPSSLTSTFTISPGGRHADAKTENKLVILRDGVYLELISFIDDSPALKHGHWWGKLPNGIIDFALTSRAVDDVDAVRDRLARLHAGLGVRYDAPRAGGRRRPDGTEVKWHVTFPALAGGELRRGSVPFWCHDVTERELRVPSHDEEATGHPSGAAGVKELVVGVPKGKIAEFGDAYAAITGAEGKKEDAKVSFAIGTPFGTEGASAIVLEPFDEEEARVVRLVMWTKKGQNPDGLDEKFGGGNAIRVDFVPQE